MKTHTRLTIAALVGAGVMVAAGCSAPGGGGGGSDEWTIPDEDPTATIRVASIMSPEQWAPIVEAFEKEHPTITVKFDQTPYEQLDSVLQTRITSKTGDPDVYWANMPDIPAQVSRGYAADLTEQLGDSTDVFLPAAIDATTVDGKLYGLPIAQSTQMLFYNKDLLAQAGVEAPSTDTGDRTTWEQLTDDARAVVDAGAQYGFLFEQSNYYQLQPLPMQLGGTAGATGEGNLEPEVDSEPWVKANEWLGSLYEEGISPRGIPSSQASTLFAAGSLAYMVGGPWNLPSLTDQEGLNWGVAAHPVFEGGEAVTPTGSWALSVNDFSKNKAAAAIFVRWMGAEDGYINNNASPELPATTTGQPFYFERDFFATDEGQIAKSLIEYETANTAVNRVKTVGFIEFNNTLTDAYADIINGSPAAEVLEKANGTIEAAWDIYGE